MPASNEYNEVCYIARYPDIKNGYIYAGTDGVWWYWSNLVKGHVKQTKRLKDNAFWHWQNFGLSEGRVCGCDLPGTNYSAEFDGDAYLNRYPDVRLSPDWHNNPQGHYQKFGITEGRRPGYEIITSQSPVGMVSPGTSTTIADNPQDSLGPGDGSIITNPVDVIPTNTTVTDTSTGTDVSAWITANPLLAAAIAAGIIIIVTHKDKHQKKRA